MSNSLLALQVALPLFAAPICVLFRNNKLAWAFATFICITCLCISAYLLYTVTSSDTIIFHKLGGWAAPVGIEYKMDPLAGLVTLVITTLSTIVVFYSRKSLQKEIPQNKVPLFLTAYLLCMTGLLGMVVTGDAFNLFVFLEISSLTSYALISMGRNKLALLASFRYLIMGTIGATFILIGIGLLYVHTGTLNMNDLAKRLPELTELKTIKVALAFIVIGLCLKIALFPLHLWLPKAYTYAPSVITAFLAATATKVAIYALIRFLFSVFGKEFAFNQLPVGEILMTLAVFAILTGSVIAIFQNNIKTLLAYSSVAQIGYMVLGISLATQASLTATTIHIVNHALIKCTLFLAVGCIVFRYGKATMTEINGLGRKMPWTMAAIVIAGLSLIGIPLTNGFISKWYFISATINEGQILLTLVILGSSLLAVIYVWKIIEAAYFRSPAPDYDDIKEAPLSFLIPVWILVILIVYLGIDTRINVGIAEQAIQTLLGAGK